MKVSFETREPVYTTFKEVPKGEVFLKDEYPYIKLDEYILVKNISVNCLNIYNGELMLLGENQKVELVEHVLTITK